MPGRSPLSPPLPRRAGTVMARPRLASELRSIARDLLGACEPDELPPDLAAWVEATTATVAEAVCDVALAALLRALETTVAGAPRELVQRLDAAAVGHDVGIA
ncbi:MAG: hypothetical protein ACRDGL_00565 [Candidatus Limnocylindrales bacterium]